MRSKSLRVKRRMNAANKAKERPDLTGSGRSIAPRYRSLSEALLDHHNGVRALAVSKALIEIDRLRSFRSETQSHIRKMTELTVATRQALFQLQKRDGAVGTPRIAQRCCLNAKQEYITMQATAHPDHRLISSEDVHGTDVYGIGDEAIGEIDHLLIEKLSGRVAYAVMSFGGFLGLAHSHYPIPWSALKYDTALQGYRTGITEAQLRDAPAFSDDSWTDRDWETRTHQHYGAPAYWGS